MPPTKVIITLALVALVVIFSIQNAEILQVNFLFWSITTRRVFILFGMLVIGIVIGLFLRVRSDAQKD